MLVRPEFKNKSAPDDKLYNIILLLKLSLSIEYILKKKYIKKYIHL
jgi:hypothetical protein